LGLPSQARPARACPFARAHARACPLDWAFISFFFASRMGKKIRQRVIWFCQDFGHSGAQKIKS